MAVRPSEGPLVARAAARAEATRADAARWQWVRQAWHGQAERPRTPAPERFSLPEPGQMTLAQWRGVRQVRLEGER